MPPTIYQEQHNVKTEMTWSFIKAFYLREVKSLRQHNIEEPLENHQFFNIKYSPNLAWSYENDHFNYK